MLFSKTSLAIAALLYSSVSNAAPHPADSSPANPGHSRRDAPGVGSSSEDAPPALLEPVIPPDVNEDALSVLALDTKVTLAWAGSTNGDSQRRAFKRDTAVLSQANFEFAHPTVALDHSTFVTSVTCSGGKLFATLSNSAYIYAKKKWPTTGDILFVTAADGCGLSNTNEYFHAKSIAFSDADKTFTATGSPAQYKDIAIRMNLKWGDAGNHNLKRAVDKRHIFEVDSLGKRAYADFTLGWEAYLHNDNFLGTDEDAPWDNAALLWKWGKSGGEKDDSYKKGEVANKEGGGHHKRSYNQTELAERELAERELDYGLALYCVECGFGGSATIWGEIDASIFFFELNTVQAGFNAEFHAGLHLGMQAFVKYEKEWEKDLFKINLPGGFSIPLLVDVGPFVSVGIEAKAGIEATGQLLIGASVNWDDIDVMIDLLDGSNSHAKGFTPRFGHRAEAAGELKLEASLGLPIKLGVQVEIVEGLWSAEAALKDTPSINAEGKFEVSATVTDDGKIEHDINGGCYGIAWNIHFENTLEAVIDADGVGEASWELMDPWESDPIAEGCIGYVNDGTDEGASDVSQPQGVGSGTGAGGNGMNSGANGLSGGGANRLKSGETPDDGEASTSSSVISSSTTTSSSSTTKATTTSKPTTTTKKPTTTSKAPACTPTAAEAVKKVAPGNICKKIATQASALEKFNVGKNTKPKTVDGCALACLKNTKCVSFGYTDKSKCQLYNKAVKSVALMTKKGEPRLNLYDKACYALKPCKK